MAKNISCFIIIAITIFLCLSESESTYYKSLSSKKGYGKEKLTYLHFFLHQMPNTNKSAGVEANEVTVAKASTTDSSPTTFGLVTVEDYLLTEKEEANSTEVGKAQGLSAFSSQTALSMMMSFNFVFTSGKYNGSTLAILGCNNLNLPYREMPIIGGSKLFRFARGYLNTTTISFDLSASDNLVEYHLYVYHY